MEIRVKATRDKLREQLNMSCKQHMAAQEQVRKLQEGTHNRLSHTECGGPDGYNSAKPVNYEKEYGNTGGSDRALG